MERINPYVPDDEIPSRSKWQLSKDKAEADSFDRQVLFDRNSTYRGSPEALQRMASRAGRRVKPEWLERGEPEVGPPAVARAKGEALLKDEDDGMYAG